MSGCDSNYVVFETISHSHFLCAVILLFILWLFLGSLFCYVHFCRQLNILTMTSPNLMASVCVASLADEGLLKWAFLHCGYTRDLVLRLSLSISCVVCQMYSTKFAVFSASSQFVNAISISASNLFRFSKLHAPNLLTDTRFTSASFPVSLEYVFKQQIEPILIDRINNCKRDPSHRVYYRKRERWGNKYLNRKR